MATPAQLLDEVHLDGDEFGLADRDVLSGTLGKDVAAARGLRGTLGVRGNRGVADPVEDLGLDRASLEDAFVAFIGLHFILEDTH